MPRIIQALRRRPLLSDCLGATSIEYGILASLVGAIIIGAVTVLGGSVSSLFDTISGALN